MPVTVNKPPELDLTIEGEKELNEQADIAARLAGYRSRREYEIAAKTALVQQFYPPTQQAQPAKKVK